MESTEQPELPGNDASWYRDLIADRVESKDVALGLETEQQPAAATEATPDFDEALSTEHDEAPPSNRAELVGAAATLDVPVQPDDSTELADDASAPHAIAPVPPMDDDAPLENTSEMVGQLWTARHSYEPLEDWEPEEIDRKVSSTRSFRWTTLIGVLAIVGLIVAGLVILPSVAERRADSYRESITDPLQALRAELPDTQTSLAIATDPASNAAALAGLTTQLTTLAARASDVDAATQADPPAAPLFTSSAAIDEVEPVRQRAEPLGPAAMAIQRRITNLVEYRTLMNGFLVLPELPTVADSDTQAALRVDLAAAQAESASILAELPDEAALEAHTAMAREINERFATWQVDYLEALRTNDATRAEALIVELEVSLVELENALVTPLAQIRREADADLIDLAREIDAVTAFADETA